MILLRLPGLDPAVNLATEEFLLTCRVHDYFMAWRNRPAVIVGRNQNPLAQVNLHYVQSRGIPVLRRISGGGAVYHDEGNINFSLIRSVGPTLEIDYHGFLAVVVRFLNQMGAKARLEGQSDIVTPQGKVSGNAQHIHKNRMLLHGTLLLDADLNALGQSLAPEKGRYADRSVDSIRKNVANLRPVLNAGLKAGEFMDRLLAFVQKEHPHCVQTALPLSEQGMIQDLARTKYKTWEWNFAKSPNYRFENTIPLPMGRMDIRLAVAKGVIQTARIRSNHFIITRDFPN